MNKNDRFREYMDKRLKVQAIIEARIGSPGRGRVCAWEGDTRNGDPVTVVPRSGTLCKCYEDCITQMLTDPYREAPCEVSDHDAGINLASQRVINSQYQRMAKLIAERDPLIDGDWGRLDDPD